MSNILVFIEGANSELKNSTKELLSVAKNSGGKVLAMALGPDAIALAEKAAHYGAEKTFISSDNQFENYNPDLFVTFVADIVKQSQANIVLGSSSSLGKDLFPRVAAKLESGCVSDCTGIEFSGDNVTVKKPIYAGKCTADVNFENSAVKFVLMRANQLKINEADSGLSTEVVEVTPPTTDLKTLIKNIVKSTSEKVDLTEANIIVAGGRGMKEAGHFKLLEELADVLGATVGASRAVCDAGWVPHSMQVGQTGKTVAPNLYIACGISGAIQHLAGMSSSKVIVAINNDPEAPIFQKSTYGIVGDLFDVVPKLTEEFKKVL